jgi:hypothetical protein
MFPQPGISPVMNAGENGAAQVIRHPVRFLVIERRRYATAAGPRLIGHGFLSSGAALHLARIQPSGAAARNIRVTVCDHHSAAKTLPRALFLALFTNFVKKVRWRGLFRLLNTYRFPIGLFHVCALAFAAQDALRPG